MKILTSNEIDELFCYAKTVDFVSYVNDIEGFVGYFRSEHQSTNNVSIEPDVILVYTLEYHGNFYYKFLSSLKPEIGPFYLEFEIQDRTSVFFGSEMRDMHKFKHMYVALFDYIFHTPDAVLNVCAPPSDIIEEVNGDHDSPSDN